MSRSRRAEAAVQADENVARDAQLILLVKQPARPPALSGRSRQEWSLWHWCANDSDQPEAAIASSKSKCLTASIPRLPSLRHLRPQRLGHTRVAFGFFHTAVRGLVDALQGAGGLVEAILPLILFTGRPCRDKSIATLCRSTCHYSTFRDKSAFAQCPFDARSAS